MAQRCISNESLCTTGFHYTLSLISGKYKMTILYTLMEFGVVRFNEMKRYIGGISYKTLSATLKELGSYADPPLSKSAVYHRVRRVEQMAREVDEGTASAGAKGAAGHR